MGNINSNYLINSDLHAGYWEWDMKGDLPFDDPSLIKSLGYDTNGPSPDVTSEGKIPAENRKVIKSQIKLHIDSHATIPLYLRSVFYAPAQDG